VKVSTNFGTCRAVGKRGGRRNCQSKAPTANERIDIGCAAEAKLVWPNHASRSLVVTANARFLRIVDLHCLSHEGCAAEHALLFRQLHLSVLFARDFWRFAAQLVWSKACVVAGLADLFSGDVDPVGAGGIPAHVLLL
jgi:hypothetical protein